MRLSPRASLAALAFVAAACRKPVPAPPSEDVVVRKEAVELPKTLSAAALDAVGRDAALSAAPVGTVARDGGLDRGKTIAIDPTLLRMLGSDEPSVAQPIHDPLDGTAGGGKGPGDIHAPGLPDAGLGGATTGGRRH